MRLRARNCDQWDANATKTYSAYKPYTGIVYLGTVRYSNYS